MKVLKAFLLVKIFMGGIGIQFEAFKNKYEHTWPKV